MKKQTFILELHDTKDRNWQGKVNWVQGKRSLSFRSVLELLGLIESAVSKEDEEPAEDMTLVGEEKV